MSSQLHTRLTPDEYLAFERSSEIRHEYVDGELVAMSGASRQHNQIVVNVSREISVQFKGRPCFVYTNDMRVRIMGTSHYVYPDAVALCGSPLFEDQEQDTLTNPNLVVEVLSTTTEAYDRGEKFEYYRSIETCNEYLLIAQDKPHVERFSRQSDGQWLFTATSGLGNSIELKSVDCRLLLAELYDKVEFGSETPLS
jgi:Uma2 family endonuclease